MAARCACRSGQVHLKCRRTAQEGDADARGEKNNQELSRKYDPAHDHAQNLANKYAPDSTFHTSYLHMACHRTAGVVRRMGHSRLKRAVFSHGSRRIVYKILALWAKMAAPDG